VTDQQKFLIVSLGSIGLRHLRNLRALRPDSMIAALRTHKTPGDSPAEGCDVEFTTMDQVAAFAPDAAVVAGPASSHIAIAAQLIDMGVDVFVEKPLSDNHADAVSLVKAGQAHGVTVMTGYSLRFMPSLIEARRRVLAGEIGAVLSVRAEVGQYLPSWRPGADYRTSVSAQRSLGGGALLELSHELDYILWCFGMPDNVFAVGGRYSSLDINVEDLAEIILGYDNARRIVSIHLDFLQHSASRQCKFIGSAGTLIWDGVADCIETRFGPNDPRNENYGPFTKDRNAMYVDELRHFLDCVSDRRDPLIDGVQGAAVVCLIDAARQSIESGGIIHLERDGHE
jgi:predicted dehydrogenase